MKSVRTLMRRTTRARWVHAVVLTRVFVGVLLLSGCVARPEYEQVSSAAEVQQEGRRRAQLQSEAQRAEIERLTAERDRLQEELRKQEEIAAHAQLDVAAQEAEKDQQALLVGQLQSELGRVAEHLKVYAEERDRLSEEKAKLLDELAHPVAVEATSPELAAEPASGELGTDPASPSESP
ncbi:MAG TPA: hypothetical protein VLC09_08295 [Polyangiaceae bacterium]|nr:hypothetical protein [Polyangiaceae bacterium]